MRSPAYELIPFVQQGLDPIKLAYKKLGSSWNRTHCYAELRVSSSAVAKTIANTQVIAPIYGGMARLSGGLDEYWDGRFTKVHHQSQY